MKARLRLGTRSSALALAQSGHIARRLEEVHDGLEVEMVPIITRGDRVRGALAEVGGKGLFTQELETGLLDGSLDLAVHSLKDLPTRLTAGLEVAAFPPRADPRDVLISEVASSIEDLPRGAVVLTGATRRRAQLLALRPDLEVRDLRGNIDTRIELWRESGAAGLLLAAAGIDRLGIDGLPAHGLAPETFIPAPGQGTLALQTSTGGRAAELCRALDHAPSATAAHAERRVVAGLGGDCTLPLGAWARRDPDSSTWTLSAFLALADGSRAARAEIRDSDPERCAERALESLFEAGAREISGLLDRAGAQR